MANQIVASDAQKKILQACRSDWVSLSDAALLAQCEVDTYRASGPGGQKRNKTSSAVRLRHAPSGMLVIAEESRSQHENKAKALKRLRIALFLYLREPVAPTDPVHPEILAAMTLSRLTATPKLPPFWPAAARLLDRLIAHEVQLSTTAAVIGTTTANLSEFLAQDPKLWQELNRYRVQYGSKPLRSE
jgi:hypothetical protein